MSLEITVLVGIPALFGLLAVAGRADPNRSNVPAHRHFINGFSGRISVTTPLIRAFRRRSTSSTTTCTA